MKRNQIQCMECCMTLDRPEKVSDSEWENMKDGFWREHAITCYDIDMDDREEEVAREITYQEFEKFLNP